VRAAVLDGVPDDPDHPKRTSVHLTRSDGALGVAEVNYAAAPANVTLGYWHYSSHFEPWSAIGSSDGRHGNQGGYAVIERRLTHVDRALPDDKRGLAAFFQAGIAAARFNRIDQYVGGGLVYTGVVASSEDRVGVTLAHALFSNDYRRWQAGNGVRIGRAENVVELTYRRSVTHFLTVQPDVQYVIRPSGQRTLHDALAIGLRFELEV
jgi:porin